jgi:multidrug transporter EmrE-like cation transporter
MSLHFYKFRTGVAFDGGRPARRALSHLAVSHLHGICVPVGTAYAVWTCVGAVGTVLMGVALFGESLDPLRLSAIGLVVAGIAILKMAPA